MNQDDLRELAEQKEKEWRVIQEKRLDFTYVLFNNKMDEKYFKPLLIF